jgi:hypothetical protein
LFFACAFVCYLIGSWFRQNSVAMVVGWVVLGFGLFGLSTKAIGLVLPAHEDGSYRFVEDDLVPTLLYLSWVYMGGVLLVFRGKR